jgi:hypothetical protein
MAATSETLSDPIFGTGRNRPLAEIDKEILADQEGDEAPEAETEKPFVRRV